MYHSDFKGVKERAHLELYAPSVGGAVLQAFPSVIWRYEVHAHPVNADEICAQAVSSSFDLVELLLLERKRDW
jgi:hypothetical protein